MIPKGVLSAPRTRKKSKPLERAYIAGLIDMNSTVTITPLNKGKGRQALDTKVVLYNQDLGLLRMVQERYDGSIFSAYTNQKASRFYKLEIRTKKEIVFIIKDVSPYLIAKKKHADLLLNYCQSRVEALEHAESPFLVQITEEEKRIARELIRLNRNSSEDRMVQRA